MEGKTTIHLFSTKLPARRPKEYQFLGLFFFLLTVTC